MFCIGINFILSTFETIRESSPPFAVLTTLARISLFPQLRISTTSILALYWVFWRSPSAFTLLPSPIFPSSSPHQQYSGLSFLTALTKKLRIVFSEFQTNLPTDPSHLPRYIQLTKDDPFFITRSLDFCSYSFILPTLLLKATPPIEVDSKIIRELILFVIGSLASILSNTQPSTISSLLFPPTLLQPLRWFLELTHKYPHKISFQTIILDDPSFPDLILNSLKLDQEIIR
ncbi:hypothetical protein BLNAU_20562 [Blattamonas nauphoetae]|uniref:Uncharacterized protein n=1 Tax=Blattamonas nauphoetae TaxID=2049346 RepID=A0ABQ9WYB9_9EUKA|nr:hypothetical protein BLNAU_20562 [Blattamonas nauphoetae]